MSRTEITAVSVTAELDSSVALYNPETFRAGMCQSRGTGELRVPVQALGL